MLDQLLTHLSQGLLNLGAWQIVLIALIMVQATIAGVTLYLHRSQAHRGLELHPLISHFFRFWLWLSTGMVTKQWVAIHRKHHAKCETAEDPHSPQIDGINKVLWDGAALYRKEANNQETMDRYGHGTPDDWIERNVYSRFSARGIFVMLIINLLLFGVAGLTVWAVQMLWIPFHAAGVINGLGHYWGYRNYETTDAATNLTPIAFWIGGEELHNNHHAFPSSAKFSTKWWEFDIGWMYIKILSFLGLAKVKKVAPKPHLDDARDKIDLETIKAIFANRLHVMANYAKQVTLPVLREQTCADNICRTTLKKAKALLIREQSLLDDRSLSELSKVLSQNQQLQTIYNFRLELQQVWSRAAASHDALVQGLKDWCAQAEATGIKVLEDFARSLRRYSLQTQ